VLGVRPLEAGCRGVTIGPILGDLSWAEGTVPTPLGPIRVRHERRGDGVHSDIDAPAGVSVLRGRPAAPTAGQSPTNTFTGPAWF